MSDLPSVPSKDSKVPTIIESIKVGLLSAITITLLGGVLSFTIPLRQSAESQSMSAIEKEIEYMRENQEQILRLLRSIDNHLEWLIRLADEESISE